MPLTLQFGPWSPDQADTPIQVPDNPGPMVVPLADCLNVYFSNGSYRSIPSPAASSINGNPIQALNTQALNAFSYYDNVALQETIFVGTSVGIQQLQSNGSWSAVSFITSQSTALIGASMAFSAGNFANTNTLHGSRLTFSTGSVQSLQTGVSFVAGLISFPGSPPLNQTFQEVGYSGIAPTFGTLVNGSMFLGTLNSLFDSGSVTSLSLKCTSNPTVSGFTTITANGITLNSSAAGYSYTASTQSAVWTWPTGFGFASGSTYSVVFA